MNHLYSCLCGEYENDYPMKKYCRQADVFYKNERHQEQNYFFQKNV